ncbi:RagB/SusD family nutrient uptake outer membrane protein [Mangrovibacterium diazotrophicum]|uniref:Putative outer membrane starch-binding protein n=1 Tax=Mangrovibacterium diazotrophicum TaxID=1261403 RepID=A0A419WBA8_9BACT|nr:RagB/SusD family nutrient uptake outer membrane protein [Mangrovibacterium diazotrophicum]RKD92743.1 putative outer membrane starch-binding protein [Mangrovibacterium diazotrophicum]
MKKIFYLLVVLAVFSACEDDLDLAPISEPSAANFYQNTTQFEQAVNGMYNTLKDYAANHFYLSEVRSDNIYSPGTGVRDWNPINNFEHNLVTNSLMAPAWDVPYLGIYRANLILDQVNEDLVPDASTRNRMIGEAKFIRALFYFDLVRFFGRVPIFDHVLTPTEALEVSRQPVADVYDLIEADLTEAASLLPASYSSPGKATSGAAKSLLAKVYLTESGPDFGIDGPGMNSNKYSDALSLINEVISSGVYGWVDDYAEIFSYTNENNDDIVFDVQSINDGSTGDRGIGTILPTLMYQESWARIYLPFAGGVPVDASGAIDPSDDFLSSFEDGDVRDDFSVLMSYLDENGNTINSPQYLKFVSLDHVPADRFNWGINFPILRYTDVLMMKAEALIQLGQDQTTVDAIVNQVRERAGLSDVSNVDMDMLLDERRHEFIAEGQRWHDLVRTGKVLTVMNAWAAVDDASSKIGTIVADDILYAIHQDQLDVKEGLYDQNPGY